MSNLFAKRCYTQKVYISKQLLRVYFDCPEEVNKLKKMLFNTSNHFVFQQLHSLQPPAALAAEKLYVYNWTDYVPSNLVAEFTKETGIEVIYSTFEVMKKCMLN